MARVTVTQVQQWLDGTKLVVTALDSELEDTMSTVVLSSLSEVFVATAWLDTTTTPKLVQKIIAMMYAAWYYRRQYSEQLETSTYADDLEAMATDVLGGIKSGQLLLSDLPLAQQTPSSQQPSFYPNDAAGAESDFLVDPNNPQNQFGGSSMQSDGIKFTMGQLW